MQSHLTTARLQLRRFTMDDFDALFALTRQTEITDILPDWGMTPEQLQGYLSYWVQNGYPNFNLQSPEILYAVCLKDQLIGWVGIWPKDELDSPYPEVAYAISRDFRRQGYACEAVGAACNAFFATVSDLAAIVAIVKGWNQASRGVVCSAGFIASGQTHLPEDGEFDLFTLPRPSTAQAPQHLECFA